MSIRTGNVTVNGVTDVYAAVGVVGYADTTLTHRLYLQNRTGNDLLLGDSADLVASPAVGLALPDGSDFDISLRSPDRLSVAPVSPGPSFGGLYAMIVTE